MSKNFRDNIADDVVLALHTSSNMARVIPLHIQPGRQPPPVSSRDCALRYCFHSIADDGSLEAAPDGRIQRSTTARNNLTKNTTIISRLEADVRR